MHAVEKSNLVDNTTKISKRKSKNRKHQSHSHTSQQTSAGKGNNELNGINGNSLNEFSEKSEQNSHIKENGCNENHLTDTEKPPQAVVNEDEVTSSSVGLATNVNIKSEVVRGNSPHVKNSTSKTPPSKRTMKIHQHLQENHSFITNGDISHKKKSNSKGKPNVSGVVNSNNISTSKEAPSPVSVVANDVIAPITTRQFDNSKKNKCEKQHDDSKEKNNLEPCEPSDSHHCQNSNQNGVTSSSSSTEQISNKDESQGLGLEKTLCSMLDTAQSSEVNGLDSNVVIEYKEYESELQMQDIMRLIQTELSEPYSIYTYRYFIYNWPKLCFLAAHGDEYVGAIVCKLDMHMNVKRGYIAMLAVKKEYRKMKIGTNLVQKAIEAMLADDADEVVLETEMKNIPALRLYENLGFVRDKRLFSYYLNGVDALRLKLWFR